jgi:hypothetical protein
VAKVLEFKGCLHRPNVLSVDKDKKQAKEVWQKKKQFVEKIVPLTLLQNCVKLVPAIGKSAECHLKSKKCNDLTFLFVSTIMLPPVLSPLEPRVARFLSEQRTKTGKIYQMTTNCSKWP